MELPLKHLDFYAHHLSQAKSEILELDDCRVDSAARIENVKLKIDAGEKQFYSGDFDLGVKCLQSNKRIRVSGSLILEKSRDLTTVKNLTFSFKEERFDYQYILSELGYFSLNDIMSFQRP